MISTTNLKPFILVISVSFIFSFSNAFAASTFADPEVELPLSGHVDYESVGLDTQEQLLDLYLNPDSIKIEFDSTEHILVGDVLFTKEQIEKQAFGGGVWKNGIIPVTFSKFVLDNSPLADPNDPNSEKVWVRNFMAACDLWSQGDTGVSCTMRSNEKDYLYVDSHTSKKLKQKSCVSFSQGIGRKGGKQLVSIFHETNTKCNSASHWNSQFVLAHEIGHVFGLYHEQSRSDRESFVKVLYANIPRNKHSQYARFKTGNYTPYDFSSIMHYSRKGANGKVAMETSDCYYGSNSIRPSAYPSFLDLKGMKYRYSVIDKDLKKVRNESCGTEILNKEEFYWNCNWLGENCQSKGLKYQSKGSYSANTWWCSNGVGVGKCGGIGGSHNSCCYGGKTPTNVVRRSGESSKCPFGTKYRSYWNCNCQSYEVNAVCP